MPRESRRPHSCCAAPTRRQQKSGVCPPMDRSKPPGGYRSRELPAVQVEPVAHCPSGPFPEGLDGLAQRVNGAPGTILNVGVVRFFSVCFTASPASLPSFTLNAIASS